VKLFVIHGPNLNLIGTRQPEIYGSITLATINDKLGELATTLDVEIDIVQSNHEGQLVDAIQTAARKGATGIIINPAAYGHTSIALRDALAAVKLPFIEVHLSNIYARESFRARTYLSDIATGTIAGLGANGYYLALRALVEILRAAGSSQTPAP